MSTDTRLQGKTDLTLHIPTLQIPEGRDYLTNKTFAMLDHAHTRYKETADWFLKADDDTYIVMENLRHLVSDLNTNKGHYLGGQIYGYNSGGAGWVQNY